MSNYKLERIANIEEEIEQLRKRQKELKQEHIKKERRDRTHRLCKRGGFFEALVPDTIPLTEEQYQTFLEKTVATEYARRILNELKAQTAQNDGVDAPEETG
jgi:hypothetical protein